MEQLKDFRLTSTPRIVWIVCLSLLVLRIALSVYEFAHPAARQPSVAWIDAANPEPNKAKKKRRLYEFYAAWCNPCERLERDVMTNAEIREYIEGNFCPIRVVDRQREDGHNDKLVSDLQKRYRVFAFPTIVATKEDGEALGSLVGNSSSLAVYRFLSRVNNDDGSTTRLK